MAGISDDCSAATQLHLAGRDDEAAKLCDRILAADPNFVDALNLRGSIAMRAGEYEEPTTDLEHAVALKPYYADAHNNLGLALQARGNLAGAISCFCRAIELQPKFAV